MVPGQGAAGPTMATLRRTGLEKAILEAASIDGAGGWERFRFITLPLLRPIILIVTLFSVIFTFADFQLIYVLTHGGPANATQLFATYAFDIAMGAGQLGLGASVALTMLPALALWWHRPRIAIPLALLPIAMDQPALRFCLMATRSARFAEGSSIRRRT